MAACSLSSQSDWSACLSISCDRSKIAIAWTSGNDYTELRCSACEQAADTDPDVGAESGRADHEPEKVSVVSLWQQQTRRQMAEKEQSARNGQRSEIVLVPCRRNCQPIRNGGQTRARCTQNHRFSNKQSNFKSRHSHQLLQNRQCLLRGLRKMWQVSQ